MGKATRYRLHQTVARFWLPISEDVSRFANLTMRLKIVKLIDYSESQRCTMEKFSTVELLRDIKTVTMAADKQPVAITQHRKPRYVLMTFDDFEAMKENADPRRVYGPYETPPDLAALIIPELDKLIADGQQDDE